MSRLTGGRILHFIGVLLLAGVWIMVHQLFGQREGVRFWGIGLLVTSVVYTLREQIPVAMGNRDLPPLKGWRKAYLLVPSYCTAVGITVFPHEAACLVNLRGYACP